MVLFDEAEQSLTERTHGLALARALVQQEAPRYLEDEVALERGEPLELGRKRVRVAGPERRARGGVGRVELEQARDRRVGRSGEVVRLEVARDFRIGSEGEGALVK